jgi:hypothetical protein
MMPVMSAFVACKNSARMACNCAISAHYLQYVALVA